MKRKTIIGILIVFLGIFVIIQVIPVSGRGTNPAVVAEPKWNSPETRALVKRACFDCHSNETVWPWYSNVAPVSWLVTRDTVEGRSRMNFSEWDANRQPGIGEISSVISEGEMPPAIYLPLHPSAQLSAAEKQQLIDGLTKSLPKKGSWMGKISK